MTTSIVMGNFVCLLLFNVIYPAIITKLYLIFCIFFLRVAIALVYFLKDFSVDDYVKLSG